MGILHIDSEHAEILNDIAWVLLVWIVAGGPALRLYSLWKQLEKSHFSG